MNCSSFADGGEVELAFEAQQEYTTSAMSKKKSTSEQPEKEPRRPTPTFLLELLLVVHEGQAKRLRAHLEAGRQFYNAVLSAGQKRLRRMRADPAWQQARAIPAPRSRSATLPLRPCGSSTAFPSMPFTSWHASCASLFWLTTWMQCWLRRWRHAPIVPSIASAWEKRAAHALRARAGGSPASRTSATTPACVSCCRSQKRAMLAT